MSIKMKWHKVIIIGLFAGLLQSAVAEELQPREAKRTGLLQVEILGEGPDMLLVSGLACGSNVWDKIKAHYAGRYRLHIITLPGCAGQPGIEAPYIQTVRDAIIAYIKEHQLNKPVIIAHSLGAMISFWVAATAPELPGALIAIDGVPAVGAAMTKNPQSWWFQFMARLMRSAGKKQSQEEFAEKNLAHTRKMVSSKDDLQKIAAQSALSHPPTIAQAFYEMVTLDNREQMADIQVPVLLLGATAGSKNDKARKKKEANYRNQVKAIAGHRVVFTSKARHFIQLDEPAWLINQVDRFLSQGMMQPEGDEEIKTRKKK